MVRFHTDLDVWNKARQLALEVYRTTKGFPREELYGLTSQLRRAAIAVVANIAEGSARRGRREFLQFCYVARGSSTEVETLLIIAKDLGWLSVHDYEELGTDIKVFLKC